MENRVDLPWSFGSWSIWRAEDSWWTRNSWVCRAFIPSHSASKWRDRGIDAAHYCNIWVTASINCDGSVGRPAIVIPCSVLQHLLEIHLTVPKISGVSVSTVRCRMAEYGLSVRDTYSDIGDDELNRLIESSNNTYPSWGVRQTSGHLISASIRIQYHRIRESLRRVDPQVSYMRRLFHLRRRKYWTAKSVAHRQEP